ncbi:MAG TPA: hypothetical protein VKC61_06690 [Pyrinomonadaceae bacterium]|nr:hypothetical protein [Pyrinomonadaceae bacterium]
MKSFLIFALLFTAIPQGQSGVVAPAISSEGLPVTILSIKWFKDRQTIEQSSTNGPAAAMIPQNKNFERNRRANNSPGERDPNLDTIDGRSAALDKAVQESRAAKPVDGFAYRVKVRNATAKPIEVIFWEYQFQESTTAAPLLRRQFLCGVAVKSGKDKELQAFSLSGPQDVVSVNILAQKSGSTGAERAVINRVEFADGSIWQRKDWNFGEVRLGYARAIATPWGTEMCRGL